MQEFNPVPGLAGRLFGGGGVAAKEAAAEVRCPRCESANTKFCYYNNYNLSQPRHFCKACRRYWTKGGLLRNVPVGGGCRKPKRPAPSSSVTDVIDRNAHRDAKNARSSAAAGHTSRASASAATTNAAAAPASNASSAAMSSVAFAAADDALSLPPPTAPMFADQAATFASLFAPPPQLSLGFASFAAPPKAEDDAVAVAGTPTEEQPPLASFNADISTFAAARSSGEPASTADWAAPPPPTAVLDAGIFDLAGETSYWNAASWTDPDGTIYQLP